ncbi:MAG: hypothetical protein ACI8TX_001559 [Hyphomicrobiaceae bacterium]|jgi:uncharacterized protein YyaL (SSP411 family)
MSDPKFQNRLASQTSLYLQQHASNPVDWYPWGEEALERSRVEDKAILISVGYSACHWCHVMERECFENEKIAALMNDLFVCVKVDREERPDLDGLYMKALQAMTGRGGWPMTVFLSPDGRPFYAGTYFPPEDRGNMPGFGRVLLGVARAWREDRDKVLESADRVVEFLRADRETGDPTQLSKSGFLNAARGLRESMDSEWGGFGSAPKFPGSMCLDLLLAADPLEPDNNDTALVRTALDRMAWGGVYDHLGGGFHRYSVDRFWLVPHFEKMLYDQALLAPLYAQAWKRFREPLYREIALGVLEYVDREMTSPQGGYFSTQDADSEGVEGKFFVWNLSEVRQVIDDADADLFCAVYGVTEQGNFEGKTILNRVLGIDEAAKRFGLEPDDVRDRLQKARGELFSHRSSRIAPGRDEKILADWNGLMIGAMATVGRLFGRGDLVKSAAKALDYLREEQMAGGRLIHSVADRKGGVGGFLDDYAFVGRGAVECFLSLGRPQDLQLAKTCADALLERFADQERGGFWFTADDAESLLTRSRDLYDGAIPSGNSVAAELLLRLWQLTGEDRYRIPGERTVDAFLSEALANPHGSAHLVGVAERHRRGYISVVVVGEGPLVQAALENPAPEVSVLQVLEGGGQVPLELVRSKVTVEGSPAAYVCRGTICEAPVTDVEDLRGLLETRPSVR